MVALAIILALSGGTYGAIYFTRTEKPVEAQQTSLTTTTPELDANVIHDLVNAERVKVGLTPLVRDSRLDASACEKMASIQTPEGVTHDGFEVYIDRQVPEATTKGENLAQSNQGDYSVVRGWMGSAAHRENLLWQKYIRVGYCTGKLPFIYMGHQDLRQAVQHFTD